MMLVSICQWRAAIGCFCTLITSITGCPLLNLLQIHCFRFIISLLSVILPLFILHFVLVYNLSIDPNVLQLAGIYSILDQILYLTIDLSKRTSVVVFSIISSNRLVVNKIHFSPVYFYIGSSAWHKLNIDLNFRDILLSGDVETNPGPETLEFCSWNLNSIIAHDFLRVSLLEAYISIYNYDLIGIVETPLDSSIDEGRLALNGYTFIKNNHPLNVKRGGIGLILKILFHS